MEGLVSSVGGPLCLCESCSFFLFHSLRLSMKHFELIYETVTSSKICTLVFLKEVSVSALCLKDNTLKKTLLIEMGAI